MSDVPPPLILSRKPRRPDGEWERATSWLGGLPKLGGRSWPRTSLERPMHFLAEVDLGEIARRAGPSILPREGALAFFIGAGPQEWEGCVIHVGQPGAEPTEPPPDAPAAFERGGEIFPADAHPSAPRSFPRWPLDVTPVPELAEIFEEQEDGDPDEWEARRRVWEARQLAAVDARFQRRQYFLSAEEAYKTLGMTARPSWWHTAQLLAECLQAALRHLPARIEQQRGFVAAAHADVAKHRPPAPRFGFGRRQPEPTPELKRAEEHLTRSEAKLADYDNRSGDFARFVGEISGWARAADPSASMPPDAAAQMNAAYQRSREEFGDFTRYRVPSRLDDLETETLRELMTGDERAFAALPEPLREHINRAYLLPSDYWHQMFGRGVDIQGNAAAEYEGNVMLLQLVYDDMMGWRFGDIGAYQFWIQRADLAAGRWKAVSLTFEAH